MAGGMESEVFEKFELSIFKYVLEVFLLFAITLKKKMMAMNHSVDALVIAPELFLRIVPE